MARLRLDGIRLGASGRAADVELVYAAYGRLDADGRNCIVLPTYYTGTHESYRPWIGPGRPFDPDRSFIVVPNMLGNGLSTVRAADTGRRWDPRSEAPVRVSDNVACQRALLSHLGVQRVALVAGWSMGGLQAYEWVVAYPDLVDAFLPICAGSRCWPLNAMFLRGLAPFLEHGLAHAEDRDSDLAAFGRAYASWAYSAAYYRDERWREDGFDTVADLLDWWSEDHQSRDPADLLTMLATWQSAHPHPAGRSLHTTLSAVTARAIVMPSTTDMYFTLAENALEASWLPHGELRPIVSDHGHIAGRPGHLPEVTAQVAAAVEDLQGPRPQV
jgi:homoserine O-acetyltransferase